MDDKIKITYPSSEKVYMTCKLHPEIKVGMRKVLLTPTVTVEDGKRTVKENDPIYVYDTSGPYSDPNVKIDLKQGLPRMRESWILQRGDVEQLDGLTSEYGRMRQEDNSLDHLRFSHIQRPYRAKAGRQVSELRRSMSALGTPNLGAIEEYARINERYEYLAGQRDDVLTSKRELEGIIQDITKQMTEIFTTEFAKINTYFGQTFTEMFGGGKASLELEDPSQPLTCGIEIRVQPPGKQLKTITLLSGGEKAFVAIALYFAILKVRPTPFCMLDEIDAALDDRNVERFASYMRAFSGNTQFIVITHRRGTMEEADVLYGVTMQEQGISKILHLNLNEMEQTLGIITEE